MEPVTLGGLVTILFGAISTLFWLVIRERDARLADRDKTIERIQKERDETIADLKDEKTKLEAKIEAQNNVIALNNESLAKNAASQETIVAMLQKLLQPPPDGGPR